MRALLSNPMYIPLVLGMLGLLSAAFRRLTNSAHWAHTGSGAVAVSCIAALLASAAQVLAAKGFDWMALAMGAMGAVSSALGMYNPTMAVQNAEDLKIIDPPAGGAGGAGK